MTTPDLGDVLRWQPEPIPGSYTCRHCGALIANSHAYAHAAFHQRSDPPPDPTENPSDLPAPGPEGTGP